MNNKESNQQQTKNTFEFKWKKQESYNSEIMEKEWGRWLLEKYFDGNTELLQAVLNPRNGRMKILDAGCGSGCSALYLFGDLLRKHQYVGIDISESIKIAEKKFKLRNLNGFFEQCDLNSIPIHYGKFDIIFSEGVLHHTNNVENSIRSLSNRLNIGGTFLFYVYVKKAPIREYTDDYVREFISKLNNEDAWEALIPLTKLGKTLGDLNIEIEVTDDIPMLGIKKGKHDLQRLLFYKICKMYYNKDYTIEEMNHINFDWFRPLNCHRHTPDEIKQYCLKNKLDIIRFKIEESGITVICKKI